MATATISIHFFGMITHAQLDDWRAALLVEVPGHPHSSVLIAAEADIDDVHGFKPLSPARQNKIITPQPVTYVAYDLKDECLRVDRETDAATAFPDSTFEDYVPSLPDISGQRAIHRDIKANKKHNGVRSSFLTETSDLKVTSRFADMAYFDDPRKPQCVAKSVIYTIRGRYGRGAAAVTLSSGMNWIRIKDGATVLIANVSKGSGHFHKFGVILEGGQDVPQPVKSGVCAAPGVPSPAGIFNPLMMDVECSSSRYP